MDKLEAVKLSVIIASMGALLGYSYGLLPIPPSRVPQNKPMHIQSRDKRNDGGTLPSPSPVVKLDHIVESMKEN